MRGAGACGRRQGRTPAKRGLIRLRRRALVAGWWRGGDEEGAAGEGGGSEQEEGGAWGSPLPGAMRVMRGGGASE